MRPLLMSSLFLLSVGAMPHHGHGQHHQIQVSGYSNFSAGTTLVVGGYPFSYWGPRRFYYGTSYYPYYGGGGTYMLPPLVVPAQTLFGPQPVQQMMGAGPAMGGGADPLPAPAAPKQRKPRVSNAETKARAGKFIGFGDTLFAKQKFREALERYKLAAQQAPDMPEIFLRQGFAAVAIAQYESAGRAFRRALKLPDWSAVKLELKDLYGDDRIAKESHFESLAMAVQANPHDANLLFVLGMELYFDGQQERAAPFFTRAAQLGGNDDHVLDEFLAAAGKPAPGPAAVIK